MLFTVQYTSVCKRAVAYLQSMHRVTMVYNQMIHYMGSPITSHCVVNSTDSRAALALVQFSPWLRTCSPQATLSRPFSPDNICHLPQLARWSEQSQPELPQSHGQLAVDRLLIRCIYQSQPQLGHCSQQQLVQLLQLAMADRHDVGRTVSATSTALSGIATAQLQWEVALACHSLSPGGPELDACKPVHQIQKTKVGPQAHPLRSHTKPHKGGGGPTTTKEL